ncbi:M20/M25/M40 family metallo-hydrolase [Candidatus Latescibacterota bacterium]
MRRRNFFRITGIGALLPVILEGYSCGTTVKDSFQLINTPEKRAIYLKKMLAALSTDIGPHPSGSLEYDLAAQIVEDEFRRVLPVVQRDTYTFDYWKLNGEPVFQVGEQKLHAIPAHGTSGTPTEGITGILVKNEGSIVYIIVDPSTGEKLARVAISESWATGLAVARPWTMYDKDPGGLPTFNLAKMDIPALEDAVKAKIPVFAQSLVEFVPGSRSSSIIGKLPGKSTDELVFFAHLDTVFCSPGANDNTASLIVILMLAQAISTSKPDKTITFIATAGEEYGWMGTKHLAQVWNDNGTLDRIRLMVNFDSLTWGPVLTVGTRDEDLCTLIATIIEEKNIPLEMIIRDMDGLGREAQPFKDSGISARGVVVDSNGPVEIRSVWHRPDDTAEKVDEKLVEYNYLLFNEFIRRVQKFL